MGSIPGIYKPVLGKYKNGMIPPKAKEERINMLEIRDRIDTKKNDLQKTGNKY